MQSLWEMIVVFVMSAFMLIKGGIAFALLFDFPFFKAITLTTLGGMAGTLFFVFLSDKIITAIKQRKAIKQNTEIQQKKIFTRKNKFIIILKKRLGLPGIAFLTPLSSYLLGCYIAVRYYQRDKQKIFIYMFGSTLLWATVVFLVKYVFYQYGIKIRI